MDAGPSSRRHDSLRARGHPLMPVAEQGHNVGVAPLSGAILWRLSSQAAAECGTAAVLQEHLHQCVVPTRRREVHGPIALAVLRIDIYSTISEKFLGHGQLPPGRRPVEGRGAPLVHSASASAAAQEDIDHLGLAVVGGTVQRRHVPTVLLAHVGATLHKLPCDLGVPGRGRDVQGRHEVSVLGVRVRAALQEQGGQGRMATVLGRGSVQWRLACGAMSWVHRSLLSKDQPLRCPEQAALHRALERVGIAALGTGRRSPPEAGGEGKGAPSALPNATAGREPGRRRHRGGAPCGGASGATCCRHRWAAPCGRKALLARHRRTRRCWWRWPGRLRAA
mmetsp:Transcript_21253/g.45159  ORF Transcript_21253/g.45159 Transcript_21253/m.45159 type:complete len:336 (-) Transcript_21253:956-1963(-)